MSCGQWAGLKTATILMRGCDLRFFELNCLSSLKSQHHERSMPIDAESSTRLNLLRFPLIVGVVFIHAYDTSVNVAEGGIGVSETGFWSDCIRNFISQGLARVAVPVFFLMSGYLFFQGFDESWDAYRAKWTSRVRTLLIPFLFWNLMVLLMIGVAQQVPATRTFFSGKNAPVFTFDAFGYLNAIFGITRPPIAYQFWFIRDLMLLVLLAPVVAFLDSNARVPSLAVLVGCWLLDVWPFRMPSAEATLFFSVGVCLAKAGKRIFWSDKYGALFVSLYLPAVLLDSLVYRQYFGPYLHRIGILLGVPAALFATKLLVTHHAKLQAAFLSLASASFFVYASHEPPLMIARKVSYKVLSPATSQGVLLLYFLNPILVLCSSLLLYRRLSRVFPGTIRLITGGR